MPRLSDSPRACARALWLLGLTPPVEPDELTAAWRQRVARAHPDRHALTPEKSEAATVLTRALNDARALVARWIASGREWPLPDGSLVVRMDEPDPWPEQEEEAREPAPVCRHTGLRRGDRVVVGPDRDDLRVVAGTEVEHPGPQVWVHLADGGSARAERVRLAAYACPVCGMCDGPGGELSARPCPQCIADLRRLERRPSDAGRVRRAIEARAESGRATAHALDEEGLAARAARRGVWARRLREAGPADLQAALLGAFTRAFDEWEVPEAAPRAAARTPAGDGAAGPPAVR
jgi:hypothetical protein